MTNPVQMGQRALVSRREFLRYAAGLGLSASSIALLSACGVQPTALTTQPSLETTTIKLAQTVIVCYAPMYIAQDLLQSEGFTDVRYPTKAPGPETVAALTSGEIDMTISPGTAHLVWVDQGAPIVALTGIHTGCWELFGTDQVNSIRDLKGKTVATAVLGGGTQIYLSTMLAYVGLDPKDVHWVAHSFAETKQLLAEGKIDAYLAFAPEPQELRAEKIGHVVVNLMMDKPWSQYFCCVLMANREFVRKNPEATKRAMRAILKATDICAKDPERVAHFMVDQGYVPNYDYTLQALREMQQMGAFNTWRELDPEDTLRFYALRLNEVGLIKSSPNDLIARASDWRFLLELKQEMKGVAAAPTYCQVS
jgi:NitT/TauT family transport system substrate-binding protein